LDLELALRKDFSTAAGREIELEIEFQIEIEVGGHFVGRADAPNNLRK